MLSGTNFVSPPLLRLFYSSLKLIEVNNCKWIEQRACIKDKIIFKGTQRNSFLPKGILVFDIDDTLLSNDKKIIEKEAIKKLLNEAKTNNFIIAIATSRTYTYELTTMTDSTIAYVLDEIGADLFSWICFTCRTAKIEFLDYLLTKYYLGDVTNKKRICLVDDNVNYMRNCSEYSCILVDKEKKYLDNIYQFILKCKSAQISPIFPRVSLLSDNNLYHIIKNSLAYYKSSEEKESYLLKIIENHDILNWILAQNDIKVLKLFFKQNSIRIIEELILCGVKNKIISASHFKYLILNIPIELSRSCFKANPMKPLMELISQKDAKKLKVMMDLPWWPTKEVIALMDKSPNLNIRKLALKCILQAYISRETELFSGCISSCIADRDKKVLYAKKLLKYVKRDISGNKISFPNEINVVWSSEKLSNIYFKVVEYCGRGDQSNPDEHLSLNLVYKGNDMKF